MKEKQVYDVSNYLPSKIKVSASLVAYTVELLENLDPEDFSPDIIQLYGYVLHAFKKKKAKFDYRDAFANFVCRQNADGEAGYCMNFQSIFDDPPFCE